MTRSQVTIASEQVKGLYFSHDAQFEDTKVTCQLDNTEKTVRFSVDEVICQPDNSERDYVSKEYRNSNGAFLS